MIFVDTGAWFASVVPSDIDHASASQWLNQNVEPLLTTDYIIDETLISCRQLFYFLKYRFIRRSVLSVLAHVEVADLSFLIQNEYRRVSYPVVLGGVEDAV